MVMFSVTSPPIFSKEEDDFLRGLEAFGLKADKPFSDSCGMDYMADRTTYINIGLTHLSTIDYIWSSQHIATRKASVHREPTMIIGETPDHFPFSVQHF